MRNILRRAAGPGIVALVGLGFDLANFFGSSALAYVAWAVAVLWAVYGVWPWLKRWRPLTLVPADGESHAVAPDPVLTQLRDRNEQLDQLNKNLEAERETVSNALQLEKRENEQLRGQIERAAREAGLPPNVATERRIANCDFHINDLLRLAGEGFIIEGKDFENCTIRGPGVISTFEDVRPPEQRPDNTSLGSTYDTDSLSVEGEPESVLWEVPWESEGANGVIYLVGCSFTRVQFKGVGIAGSPEEIKFWRENVRFRGRGSVGLLGTEVRWEVVREEDGEG